MKKKVIITFSIVLIISLFLAWFANDEIEELAIYASLISALVILLSFIFCGQEDGKCLENLRNISSVIIVGLAIFGYFYTVRPTYENKMLSREKSKLVDSLSNVKKNIDSLNQEKYNITINLIQTKESLANVIEKFEGLNIENRKLIKKNELLSTEKNKKENEISEIQNKFIKDRIDGFIDQIKLSATEYMLVGNVSEYIAEDFIINYKGRLTGSVTDIFSSYFRENLRTYPDSIDNILFKNASKIYRDNKPNLFNNYDTTGLSVALNVYKEIKRDCPKTEDCSENLSVQFKKVQSAIDNICKKGMDDFIYLLSRELYSLYKIKEYKKSRIGYIKND